MKHKQFPIWIYTLTTFISLYISRNIFEKSNFILDNFNDRTIGIAVLMGVDIAARSITYLKVVSIFILSFLVFFFIIYTIWKFALKRVGSKDLKKDALMIFTISTLSIFILIYHYINGSEIVVGILDILKVFIFLIFSMLIAKIFFKRIDTTFYKLINNYSIVVLSFLFPFVIFFTRWVLISGSFIFTKIFFVIFMLLWLAFWLILRTYFYFVPNNKHPQKIVSILLASIPLLLIPISIPIVNEIQYTLSNKINLSITTSLVISTSILFISSLIILLFNRVRNTKFNFSKFIFFPLFIATVTLFNTHTNFLDINYLDTFHHGENLISTQQLFMFGKIPFVNLYPTHGISYMFSQTLYSLINGYSPFTPWLWEWVTKTIEVVLLYFLISKITNSFFSASLTIFIPILGIFGGQALIYGYSKELPTTYYFAPILVGLTLIWALKSPTYYRILTLCISCIFLILWRIDFGIAGLISTCFIIFMQAIDSYIKKRTISKELITFIKCITLTGIVALIIFFATSIVSSESFSQIIIQIFEFIKFQAQAQGLPNVISAYSPISMFQYFILPSIGIFYVIYYIFNIFFQKDVYIPKYKILLIYIATFSLIVFIRSFQRHTLAVLGYNPYLFVFLMLCLPILNSKRKSLTSILIFIIGLLFYQFVLPNSTLLLRSGQQIKTYNWHDKESRVHLNDSKLEKLVSFINSNLEPEQTFLDLTSSPLLYVASNRIFNGYFIPNAYHTSDIVQTNELMRITAAHLENKIPIVVFRQPNPDANIIDGVSNEIRSYKIYEFINSHYHPIGSVDGYSIWITNEFKLKNLTNLIQNTDIYQKFDLQMLPYIWGMYDTKDATNRTSVLSTITVNPIDITNKPTLLNIPTNIDKTSGNYIHFKIKAGSSGTITVNYGQGTVSQFSFNLIQSQGVEDYLVRVSSQFNWSVNNIKRLEISSSVPVTIEEILIRKGD